MSQEQKLSLPMAILVNVNIMLGAGIFINTAELARMAGALGAFGYPGVALLMLPLILSIATLLRIHPGGGFYEFGARGIAPVAGFLSSWSYFTGKLASAAIMIHAAVSLIQEVIPVFAAANTLVIDVVILTLFTFLNMLNVRIGSAVQALFMGMKLVPIIFVILCGIAFISGTHFGGEHLIWQGMPSMVPLLIYATIGFEAACSLSGKIEDPAKNAPRAVLYSYAFVIGIAFLYQFIFYGVLGNVLAWLDYRMIFSSFISAVMPIGTGGLVQFMLPLFVASSALGGAYGILFSNNWNLHTLASHGHIFGARLLRRLNLHGIPTACVIVEGFICLLYLLITRGKQIPLQQIAALGCLLAFAISALSLLFSCLRSGRCARPLAVPLLALGNCLLLAFVCTQQLMRTGMLPFFYFCLMLLFGVVMFRVTKWQRA